MFGEYEYRIVAHRVVGVVPVWILLFRHPSLSVPSIMNQECCQREGGREGERERYIMRCQQARIRLLEASKTDSSLSRRESRVVMLRVDLGVVLKIDGGSVVEWEGVFPLV